MSQEAILLAKVAALKKSFTKIEFRGNRCLGISLEPLLPRYKSIIEKLKEMNSDLYDDLPETSLPQSIGNSSDGPLYEKHSVDPLLANLDYVLELSSNLRIGVNLEEKEIIRRVFITHGRSNEWYKVQNYLERDLKIPTMELAQEPNLGRTILQKLEEESRRCSVAVIVMTGDDVVTDTDVRSRENVMHEIGYFQGRYGLNKVVLLHEHGVSIPSNIHGLVYIGFPKDTVEASLGALTRELNVLMNS